ncbi:hypothetical protein C4568_03295 [Candidatus Parcubacteria bacterium]|nr:MAG: hypothetical protein C4568_03295 [Candidatus Parcubacteria bacterium]
MDWLVKHKLVAGIVILVITAAAWYMLSGSAPADDAVLMTENVQDIPPEAQELLDSLRRLQEVDLDSPIFANPSFQVLKDFTTPVIPEPIGRTNPFAPLGVQ